MNPKVDAFLRSSAQWREEFVLLRKIALGCGLDEDLKWGHPCYCYQGRNVALIHGFKNYCAVLFMKGALLRDKAGRLVRQTANVQAARQLRFTSVSEVTRARALIDRYLKEALQIEKSGQKVRFRKTAQFKVPQELQQVLQDDPDFRAAFVALTPGRQRAYLLHFGGAKQSKTRAARIEKAFDRIMAGKGLDDQ